jgi:UDP-glucose 4-epimerase
MRVLITGVSGFIGKNCLEFFPKDIEIIGVYNSSTTINDFVSDKKISNVKLYRCDLTDETQVQKLFLTIGDTFDNCIYLTSNVSIPLSISNPSKDLSINTISLINTLKYASFNKFIYMSTAGVYDGLKGKVDTNSKLNPINPYCISKLAAEQYVKYFRSSGRIKNYYILRLGGAYGKYSENKFITILVKDILIKNKKKISIYGDGKNIIKTMFVRDIIYSLLKCLKSDVKNVSCNLGQFSLTVEHLVNEVAKIFKKEITISYTPINREQKYIYFEEKNDFNKIFNHNYNYNLRQGMKEFAQDLIEI